MAETTKGSSLDQLDLSDLALSPYKVNEAKAPNHKTMEDAVRAAKIDESWANINTADIGKSSLVRDIVMTLARTSVDGVRNMPAYTVLAANNALENPITAVGTALGARAGWKVATKTAAKTVAGRIGEGILATGTSVIGGAIGGAIAGVLEPTTLGDDTFHDYEHAQMFEAARINSDSWNEYVESVKGVEYPDKNVAMNVLTNAVNWANKSIEERQLLRQAQAEIEGIDTENKAVKAAEIIGNMAGVLTLAGLTHGALNKPKVKVLREATRFRPAKTELVQPKRAEIAEKVQNTLQAYTGVQMAGQYEYDSIQDYKEKTGDKELDFYTPSKEHTASMIAYGSIGSAIEFGLGGVESIVTGAWKKLGLGLRTKPLEAFAKSAVGEGSEELLQGLLEGLGRKADGTTDKTWKEIIFESLNSAAWGAAIGGPIGGITFIKSRNNLVKSIKKVAPNISNQEARALATTMIESVNQATDPENTTLKEELKKNIQAVYEDNENIDKYDIEQITDNVMTMIVTQSIQRGTKIREHEYFKQGNINKLGWFLEGIPVASRTEVENAIRNIDDINKKVKDLQDKIDALRKAGDTEGVRATAEELDRAEEIQGYAVNFKTLVSEANKAKTKSIIKQSQQGPSLRAIRNSIKASFRSVDQKILDKKRDIKLEKALARQAKVDEEFKPKRYFYKRINLDFAKRSGILEAWTDKDDKLTQGKLFTKVGGISDWNEIIEHMVLEEVMPDTYKAPGSTYESDLAIEEKVKDIVLNNKDIRQGTQVAETGQFTSEQVDNLNSEGVHTALLEAGYTEDQIAKMTYDEKNEALAKSIKEDIKPEGPALEDLEGIDFQSGNRGAYIPELRLVMIANKADATTLSHELAHDWFEQNFLRWKSENGSEAFNKSWGALMEGFGLTRESSKADVKKASEGFARAYEGWLLNRTDYEKNVDDKDKDQYEIQFKAYQEHLRDIYDSITNPYFKDAWGKLGELKPEIKEWFDKVTQMDQPKTFQDQVSRAISTVIENTDDPETRKDLEYAQARMDTSRYEVEGGNKNSTQMRLSRLAKAIDENNMIANKNYNTHRDMIQVAKDADTFVRTRREEAMKIINEELPETEGLYKEDLYTAFERMAVDNNDYDLLMELKDSKVANGLAKELGQRVAGYRQWRTDIADVITPIKYLERQFNEAYNTRKGKQKVDQSTNEFKSEVEIADKTAMKEIDSFMEDLKCKGE